MENKTNKAFNYEAFFSLHLDLMCIANLDGTFLKLNEAWGPALGYKKEDLLNTNFMSYIHPDDIQSTIDVMTTLSGKSSVLNFVNRYRHKNGSYRFIEWRSHLLGDKIYAAARDITLYKEQENELKQNELRLRGILESQSNYIIRLDTNLNYTFVNKQYENDFNWLTEDNNLLGKNCSISVKEISLAPIAKCAKECLENPGKTYQAEVEQKTKDNKRFCVLWECFCLVNDEGKPSEIQCIGVDITERKNREEAELIAQQNAILEMSTPVTQLWDGILLLPLVGLISTQRAENILQSVLKKISDTQAQILILDISGVPVVDSDVANHFIKLSKATRLMGCLCTISGIAPAVSETMIGLGVQIEAVNTSGTMKDALEKALNNTGLKIINLKKIQ